MITSTISHIGIRFGVSTKRRITPQDFLDGVETLKPEGKLSVKIEHPGKGPEHFLNWAKDELFEAEEDSGDAAVRKYFNVSVLAKCAVECLVDWYLTSSFLDLTIRKHAGLKEKLDALYAESVLGIGLSLFDEIIFSPRNKAIHGYELIDASLARRSYELANLAIINCQNTKRPDLSTIFYGTLDLVRGEEARIACNFPMPDIEAEETKYWYFRGLGPKDTCSVFIDRTLDDPRIALLHSFGKGETEIRFCSIKEFNSEQLRHIFACLNDESPRDLILNDHEMGSILKILKDSLK